MSEIRLMFVAQGAGGLPEDRIVNVFHFQGSGTFSDDLAPAMTDVTDFYNGANTTYSIAQYLSPWVGRNAEMRGYDMSLPKPRVPSTSPLVLTASIGPNGLPEELATCITLHGVVPPALTRRRRGRLYIGPLSNAALAYGSDSLPSRPAAAFIADLAVAAERLRVGSSLNINWSILSSLPSQNFVRVAAGYVDNAWDIQRRRGPDASARSPWGFPNI